MVYRRIGFLLGAGWIVGRYVILHLLSLRLAPQDPLFNTMSLWVGSGSLAVAAIFVGAAFIEDSRRFYAPILRISFVLFSVTDALAVIRGASLTVAERQGEGEAAMAQLAFFLTFGVLIVDLLLLASLLAYRVMDKNGETVENQPATEGTASEE